MGECPASVVWAPIRCLLDDGGVLPWTMEDPGLVPGVEECSLATSLRGAPVGPAYLARPTGV